MFITYQNENRIKREVRYVYYVLTWKLKLFFRRIKIDGFSVGFPPSLNINFKLMSMSEYYKKYCSKDTVSICQATMHRMQN